MGRKTYFIGFTVIFVIVFSVYFYTVAPTLSFWDCGEYIACAHSLGVPHPPGSPFHVLIRKIFTLIPFGKEIGFRANMLSVLSGSFTCGFLWIILVKIIARVKKLNSKKDKILAWISGGVGSLIAAFSYTPWWNSVESEAYGVSTSILIFCLWLTLKWEENLTTGEHRKYLLLLGYLIALSAGIHLTPLLAVPGILLFIFIRNRQTINDPIVLRFILLVLPFFALCATVPPLIVFLLGGIAIGFILFPGKGVKIDRRFFLVAGTVIIIGFTTYGYLIIRARLNPRINEVAPTNFSKLWESFTRKQYGPSGLKIIFKRKTASDKNNYNFLQALGWQYKFFGDYLMWQWFPYPREVRWEKRELHKVVRTVSIVGNVLFVLLNILGLLWHIKKEKNTFTLVGGAFLTTTLLFVFYMNFKFSPSDPNPLHEPREVRERHYFFGPAFVLFALYIGIGFYSLISKLKEKLTFFVFPLALISFVPLVSNFWSHANRRGLWLADDYGYNLLMSCEDNAVLFTNGDNDTFPLWFAQEVKNTKPTVNIANLSLLNTNWHIKQLKARGVPISFTDYEIDNLEGLPIPEMKDGKMREGKILITKDIAVRDIIATNGGYKFKKKIFLPIKRNVLPKKYRKKFPKKMDIIRPNYYVRRLPEKYWVRVPEEYLLPQNEFADLILKEGYEGKIPIYFAVTVSEDNIEGFIPYLKMEGLVNRVVGGDKEYSNTVKLSVRIPMFDVKKTDSLLLSVYRYRSLFDPKVYIDQNCARLLTNYSATYFYLGTAYKILKKIHKAIEVFEQGRKINKRGKKAPFPFEYELALLYGELGEYSKVEEYLKSVKHGTEEKASLWYQLGRRYLTKNKIEEAKKCFRKAVYSTPKKPSWGYSGLLEVYYKEKDTTKLKEILHLCVKHPEVAGKVLHILKENDLRGVQKLLLTEWLKYYPNDTIAKRLLNEI